MIVNPPCMDGFKPFGIPMVDLEPVVLLYEEYESIRLSDYVGLTHEQSAERMRVSRPTYTRIYEKARRTIAKAFVEGKAIFIEGGCFGTKDCWYRCENCMKLVMATSETTHCKYCGSQKIKLLSQFEHA